MAIDAEGPQRQALVHLIAKEIMGSLSELDLYSDEYAKLTLESLRTLDDAGLFADDGLRRCIETLYEPEGGVALLGAEISGLLRDAAGVEHLGPGRRVRAMAMASDWREHVTGRRRAEPEYVSVGDVAARYGVTTQAVYKWLRDERIEATRGPGGSGGSGRAVRSRQSSRHRPAPTRRAQAASAVGSRRRGAPR